MKKIQSLFGLASALLGVTLFSTGFLTLAGAASTSTNALAPTSVTKKTVTPALPVTQKLPASVAVQLPSDPLDACDFKLDAAFKNYNPKNNIPPSYAAAKTRVAETRGLLKEDPKSKEAPTWLLTASLLTETALTEMQIAAKQAERAQLIDQRIATISDINNTQTEISKLERGYATSLKTDLEEQRHLAEQARLEAEKAKQDAEKRFSELNSALIQVHKDARGTIISMSDILFDVGKATLTTDLKINLAKIAGILTIYKDANVVVEGHTDNVGGEEYNQKLSEKRASNVMDYLVTPGGVAASRLTSAGFGFSKPVADNATKEGRQKNRRVDLVILDKKP